MGYDWDFRFLAPYASAFLRGAWVTVQLSVASFVIGSCIGTIVGAALRYVPFRSFFFIVNDCIRAIPLFVFLLFVYFIPYPQLFGVPGPSPFACAVIAISFSQAAYTVDLVRAAIDGVSSRTLQGARALGLREIDVFRFVILPDIFRQMLPAQLAFFIGIIRLTSIASVIGCEEVVYVARLAISQNFRSFEAWIVVSAVYIALVVPLTILHRRLESSRWLKRRW